MYWSFTFIFSIYTIVLLPTNDLFFEYNEKAYSFIIEIISYTNHVLNKFIYPIIEIYLTSGYISARYKFLHISLKEWILNLNAYWLTVIGLIIHAIFVDFYENTLKFLLNYLNIMDLINVYFEIAYSLVNLTLYYNKLFKLNEEYKYFMLGKMSIYKRKRLEKFKKHFKNLCQLNLTYIKDNAKFNCLSKIPTFIEKIKSEQYFNMEELGLVEPEILDESMTRKKLENLISEPYEKCKSYSRRLDRIKNIKEDILGQKDQMENEKCIHKLIKNCKTNKCEKIIFGFYAFLCVLIILAEFTLFNSPVLTEGDKNNSNNYNSSSTNKKNEQHEDLRNISEEIPGCLGFYPILYFFLNLGTGLYILPMIYALINRKKISGDFLYVKNSSDTIDLVVSLEKITEMVFPCLYLSSIFYGMIFYRKKENIKFDISCLTFFEIPNYNIIFLFKYIPFIFFMILNRFFESINIKFFKVHISDECFFDPFCNPCFEERRKEYIEEGKKEMTTGTTSNELNKKFNY